MSVKTRCSCGMLYDSDSAQEACEALHDEPDIEFLREQVSSLQSKLQASEERVKELEKANFLNLDTLEDNKDFEGFIRAFWRRIAPYRHKYGKEIPFDERGKLPVEFTANMLTAFTIFKR
jgi:hypothetical protein